MSEGFVVIFRAVVAFVTLLVFCRIIGKTQVSQLTFFEYVLGITIGSAASTLTTSLNERPWPIWVGLFTWTALAVLAQMVTLKYRPIEKIVDGEPTIVVQNGKILEKNMREMRLKTSELKALLRNKGVFNLADVEFAILETDGQVSVLQKSQKRPVTPEDLKIATNYEGLPIEIIYDGEIVKQNLERLNLDEQWVNQQLHKLNIFDVKEVDFAELDSLGNFLVDKTRDDASKVHDVSDYDGPN